MYKLFTKNGSVVFMTIEDLMFYVVNAINKLNNDDSFIIITKLEDFEV